MAAVVLYIAVIEGRRAGFAAFALWLVLLFVLVVWLPRAAHRAFRHGNFKRSKFLYKLLRLWALRRSARASVDVSVAACTLALEDWDRAVDLLDRVDMDALGAAARAAWLNNRAYAMTRAGRDPHAALDYADQAIALRPDVAGFRHTRGITLLALDRTDEAITELDRLWSQLSGQSDDESRILEAERCYDLGRAWHKKGEREYAMDYFQRSCRASAQSRWSERAAEHLEPISEPALADLLE